MVYSSSLFLFGFFPLFFMAYFVVPNKLKNWVIIFGSLFFYAWGAHSFCVIVVVTLFVDWVLGKIIYKFKFGQDKSITWKLCVALDVVMNMGILIYFKYTNFFIGNINTILEKMATSTLVIENVLLPLGISFVVFQKVTYCLDISKGTVKPAKNFSNLVVYMFVFPAIIAGPIVKYGEIAEQITNRVLTWEKFIYGLERFALGLFKKVWIADVLARYADNVFSAGADIPFDYAWIGAVAYTFQIFFDFSGYSDMAIGMLAMMGFNIGENFNAPYIAKSFGEFWKRWHISLTSWLREYIYFPIGGNRKGKMRTYINQWLVFLISGIWHGAAWHFVFWGLYHGTFICLEKIFNTSKWRVPKVCRWFVTFVLVVIGWVFFRADDMSAAFVYIGNMFNFGNFFVHVNPGKILVIDNIGILIFILAAVMCAVPFLENRYDKVKSFLKEKAQVPLAIGALALLVISALKVITADISPFIYFMF